MSITRSIPEPVQRVIRQRCCFGCIVCGSPFFEYHHIEEYSKKREHNPEQIVLLCPGHHADFHGRRLPLSTLLNMNERPFNAKSSFTSAYKFFQAARSFEFILGTLTYEFPSVFENAIMQGLNISGKIMVAIENEDGNLLVHVVMTDFQGNEILIIRKGELTVSTGVWDYDFAGPHLTIRESRRNLQLSIEVMDGALRITHGLFMVPPVGLEVFPDRCVTHPGGGTQINVRIRAYLCAMMLG